MRLSSTRWTLSPTWREGPASVLMPHRPASAPGKPAPSCEAKRSCNSRCSLAAPSSLRRSCPTLRGEQDPVDDALVAGAAADVAGDRLSDLVLLRVWVLAQELRRGHHHPRRAEAALERERVPEGLL